MTYEQLIQRIMDALSYEEFILELLDCDEQALWDMIAELGLDDPETGEEDVDDQG